MDAKVIIPKGLNVVSGSAMVKVQVNINSQNAASAADTTVKSDKVVQKNLDLDIKSINLDGNYDAKLDNYKISLTVSGVESVINYLDLNSFSALVDLASLTEGDHTVNVNVSMPKGVTLVSQNPDKVGVTITKKQTEVPTTNDTSK